MKQENLKLKCRKEFNHIVQDAIKKGKLEYEDTAENAMEIFEFSHISRGKGKIIYNSYSDEELCQIIRTKAMKLGYVPAQKEFYWLYRVYIKKRFGNWPKALKAAGLSKNAGKGGDSYERIKIKKEIDLQKFEELRQKAQELGRPPHMHEMEEMAERFKNKFNTWADLLEAAGIDNRWKKEKFVYKVKDLSEENKKNLNDIYKKALVLGRAPMRREIDTEIRQKLKMDCGTWRNILYQVDLEPVQRIKPFSVTYLDGRKNRNLSHKEALDGCVFKLISADKKTIKQLKLLKEKADVLKRPLIKAEIPKDVYENLINQCVSYRNIIFQIGYKPLEKLKEKEIEKKLRMQEK